MNDKPESMYDKLGDLLSVALDSGFIFNPQDSPDFEKNERQTETASSGEPINQAEEKSGIGHSDKFGSSSSFNNASQGIKGSFGSRVLYKSTQIKNLTEKQKSAFQAITIPFEADFETAKKIFHEKLMYYHPDRRNDNAVLQKVASEKTENLLKNWQIVESSYKN